MVWQEFQRKASVTMFSGKVEVRLLLPNDISWGRLNDINGLLLRQHSKAVAVRQAELVSFTEKEKVVVAWLDDRIVGVGVLFFRPCLTFSYGEIRHVEVEKDIFDSLVTKKRIVEELFEHARAITKISRVLISVHEDDVDLAAVLEALGLKAESKLRYRLIIKR